MQLKGSHAPPIGGLSAVRISRRLYMRAGRSRASPVAPLHGLARLVHSSTFHDDLEHHRVDTFEEATIFQRT
eukprot:8242574-Alexandrium_andersonii.AAC.1